MKSSRIPAAILLCTLSPSLHPAFFTLRAEGEKGSVYGVGMHDFNMSYALHV